MPASTGFIRVRIHRANGDALTMIFSNLTWIIIFEETDWFLMQYTVFSVKYEIFLTWLQINSTMS